jgi:exodeoxyribonuclease-3
LFIKNSSSPLLIIGGDLNVARFETDVHNPKSLSRKAGFTREERESFETLLENCELVDVADYFNPLSTGEERYTFYGKFQRKSKRGWRLDYFLCSDVEKVQTYKILKDFDPLREDHIPLSVIFTP